MIRRIRAEDKEIYVEMARDFYHSDAVLYPVPDGYLEATFEEALQSDVYVECYLLEYDAKIAGYALLSKSFSQEAGGVVVWIEELYVLEEYRSKGLGREFFSYLEANKGERVTRLRLEVEAYNTKAVALYERLGYEKLDYNQMIKEFH